MGRGRGGRGGGRGGGSWGFRGSKSAYSKRLDTMRVSSGYLRDDAVEIVEDQDMRELYEHGFYGKGTVSRRQPNRAMLLPAELMEHINVAGGGGGSGGGEGGGAPLRSAAAIALSSGLLQGQPKRRPASSALPAPGPPTLSTSEPIPSAMEEEGAGAAPCAASEPAAALQQALPASALAAEGTSAEGNAAASAPLIPEGAAAEGAASAPAAPARPTYTDHLTLLCADFEAHITKATLPNAFYAAAAASCHSHDALPFETARQVVHYISCPPPRLRHIAEALGEGAEGEEVKAAIAKLDKLSGKRRKKGAAAGIIGGEKHVGPQPLSEKQLKQLAEQAAVEAAAAAAAASGGGGGADASESHPSGSAAPADAGSGASGATAVAEQAASAASSAAPALDCETKGAASGAVEPSTAEAGASALIEGESSSAAEASNMAVEVSSSEGCTAAVPAPVGDTPAGDTAAPAVDTADGAVAAKLKKERKPYVPTPSVRFKFVVFETSILEPEAALYAVARSKGRFNVYLPGIHTCPEVLAAEAVWAAEVQRVQAQAAAAGITDAESLAALMPAPPAPPSPLTVDQLWVHFCARIRNFPARYAVYAHCRDR